MKFASQVTQLFIDVIFGVAMLAMVFYKPDFFLDGINFLGSKLHLQKLQENIYWLMGFPAGFKTNLIISHFLGTAVLELIDIWNQVTSALTQIRYFILLYVSGIGMLGLSV